MNSYVNKTYALNKGLAFHTDDGIPGIQVRSLSYLLSVILRYIDHALSSEVLEWQCTPNSLTTGPPSSLSNSGTLFE
jgi:hypothetical protein